MERKGITNADQYFNEIKDKLLRETACLLHHFILTYDGVSCRMTYNIPFYYGQRWICYLNLNRFGQLELAFTYGYKLLNVHGLLKSYGRKQVAGTFFDPGDEIPFDIIDELMLEALALDQVMRKPR